MDEYQKERSISIFRKSRWFSVLSFIVIVLGITNELHMVIIIISTILYVISFGYIALWKCPNCGRLYSTKLSFISICWPYIGHCLHCGKSINIRNEI